MAVPLITISPPPQQHPETEGFLSAELPRRIKDNNNNKRAPSIISNNIRTIVEHLQELRVPWKRDVPLITGLDRILLLTNRPPPAAAEVIILCGVQPPRYLWYMLSGALCDAIQIATLFCLHQMITDGTACWCLGFLLSIPFRHSSHRYLVFGDYVGGYYRSLGRMYAGYSVIIVLSTVFNFVVGRFLHIAVSWLWVLTMMWTGIANYFILKYFWSYGGSKTMMTTTGSTTIAPKEMAVLRSV